MTLMYVQYEEKVRFMEMLVEKSASYDDDINMTLSLIKYDSRYRAAGDRARQWLLHFFAYQRQVTKLQCFAIDFVCLTNVGAAQCTCFRSPLRNHLLGLQSRL